MLGGEGTQFQENVSEKVPQFILEQHINDGRISTAKQEFTKVEIKDTCVKSLLFFFYRFCRFSCISELCTFSWPFRVF